MKYYERVMLNDSEIAQAKKLAAKVQAEDHTYKEIYLSNQFNYYSEMPTFVIAKKDDKMIGLAMLYADEKPGEEDVELHIEVDPEFRKQGIATEMLKLAKKILVKYGYNNYVFLTERAFLNQNSDFLSNTKLVIDDFDYYMRNDQPKEVADDDKLNGILRVRQMTEKDIEELVPICYEAFGGDIESSKNYIVESLKDEKTLAYILVRNEKPIGYCAIDLGSEEDYFFGLFISKEFRGQGYGTFFIKKLMELRKQAGTTIFILEVEPDNPVAIEVYKNVGFKIASEVIYLKENEN